MENVVNNQVVAKKSVNDVTDALFSEISEIVKAKYASDLRKDPKTTGASIQIYVREALMAKGADDVSIKVRMNDGVQDSTKGQTYTFLTVRPRVDGLTTAIDFSQRCQATSGEVKAMKGIADSNLDIVEAVCIAGFAVATEGEGADAQTVEKWSFKWDELWYREDDEIKSFRYSGKTRKWHEGKDGKPGYFDAPIAD